MMMHKPNSFGLQLALFHIRNQFTDPFRPINKGNPSTEFHQICCGFDCIRRSAADILPGMQPVLSFCAKAAVLCKIWRITDDIIKLTGGKQAFILL